MGRALARRMAARGDRLFLLGRDRDDLERSARDLEIRGGAAASPPPPATCSTAQTLRARARSRAARRSAASTRSSSPPGCSRTQDALEADAELRDRSARRRLHQHGRSSASRRARRCSRGGGGTLCVFSSVAGERGRKPVVLYGAAKAGLSRYLEGLDHKFRASGLRTICVKPGFVKTGMTDGLQAAAVRRRARRRRADVVRAIDRGTPVVYAPRIWRWVMLVIRSLPRSVMRRIGF